MGVADLEQGTRAPGELTQPIMRRHLAAARSYWLYISCLAPCRAALTPCPTSAAVRPRNSADLGWHTCAETSSAKAASARSKGTDKLNKAAQAPGAARTYGQVAQPGYPVELRERPVNTPPSYDEAESCCNIQWMLFIFGLVFVLPSYIATVLPLCSEPRFPTRGHKCAHPLETLS